MSEPTAEKPIRLNIQLPADLEATYVNVALISHSASEIIIDYARVMPNTSISKIHARIVMTPMNAKLLYRALGENLKNFEAKYGEIQTPSQNIIIDRDHGFNLK